MNSKSPTQSVQEETNGLAKRFKPWAPLEALQKPLVHIALGSPDTQERRESAQDNARPPGLGGRCWPRTYDDGGLTEAHAHTHTHLTHTHTHARTHTHTHTRTHAHTHTHTHTHTHAHTHHTHHTQTHRHRHKHRHTQSEDINNTTMCLKMASRYHSHKETTSINAEPYKIPDQTSHPLPNVCTRPTIRPSTPIPKSSHQHQSVELPYLSIEFKIGCVQRSFDPLHNITQAQQQATQT